MGLPGMEQDETLPVGILSGPSNFQVSVGGADLPGLHDERCLCLSFQMNRPSASLRTYLRPMNMVFAIGISA